MALIIVNSLTDTVDASDGVTTLREALVLANADPGADRIEFAEAGTVALGGASLVLSSDVVIDGDTDGDGEADITITGSSGARVVSILSGTATIENLTLTRGGGIVHVAEGADATISNSTLSEGRAREGGGILNHGTLTVLDSVITGNSAYFGGGIYSLGDSVTTIERSAIVGNMAGPTSPPVGAYGGGIAAEGRSLVTIRSSTIAGNTIVDGDSGGIYIGSNASVIATNATVTGNDQAGIVSRGNLDLTNSIVLGNQGANVVFGGEDAPSAITFVNSLVSGDPLAVFAKIDPATGGGVAEDNGGSVPTVALRDDPANPALDAGIDRLAPITDARRVAARFNVPDVLNNGTNTSDLGAFELRTATSGDDPLFGTPGDDTLDGLAGDDTVSGRGGDDLITGGTGDDTLLGDGGDDTLLGDEGADRLDGGAGRDTARYGTVSVRYVDHYITLPNGTRFPVYATRDEGHTIDLLDPTRNTNDAVGDTFVSVEIIEGGELADRFYGTGASVDFLRGGGGGDTLVGRGQSDYLDGGDAGDLLIGGRGNDVLTGGAGSDYIRGDAGIDRVTFGTAVTVDLADVAANTGEAAGDRYFDIENIDGSNGDDDLRGDGQGNAIRGRDGDDTLAGRGGDDVLEGGRGPDILTGGAGADTFLFTGVNQGGDTITDFEAGVDRLAFASAGFGGLPTGTLAEPRFVAGPLPLNANDRFMYDQETGALYYDADGRFTGEAKLMTVLDGAPALDFADIVIV